MNTTYYFVSVNCPLKESFMDDEWLKKSTKDCRIALNGGFNIVCRHESHSFYLYEFGKSKPASSAVSSDFILFTEDVPTSKILCEKGDDLMSIDFDLATISDAEQAAKKTAEKTAD